MINLINIAIVIIIHISYSKSDIIFNLSCTTCNCSRELIESFMLFAESWILQFQVLKLFVLRFTIALKCFSQVIDPFAELFVKLVKVSLSFLLQLLNAVLNFTLLLLLTIQYSPEVVDVRLNIDWTTSMFYTSSLTVAL